MYRDGAGADNAPATLGLGFPEGRAHPWVGLGHPAGMGDLIKTIRRRDGADLNGFEQYLVAGMARRQVTCLRGSRDVF